MADHVPVLDITVDYKDSKTSIETILKVIRPEWNSDLVEMKDLSIGYVNKNVGCYYEGRTEGGVFVRMINHNVKNGMVDDYKTISRFLNQHQLSSKLLAEFTNGICSELVVGECLSWETTERLRDEVVAQAVIRYLIRFHSEEVYRAAVRDGIIDHTDKASDKQEERARRTNGLWAKFVHNPEIPQSIKDQLPTLEELMTEMSYLRDLNDSVEQEKALLHMDTNPSNIIIKPDGEVMIVDYDMTGIGYISSDLAGLFHAFINIRNPVMSDYPDCEFRRKMIRYYLEERAIKNCTKETVTDEMVDNLNDRVDIARLTWLFRYIFVGPFLVHLNPSEPGGNGKIDQLYGSSIKFYEEYKRRKAEFSL